MSSVPMRRGPPDEMPDYSAIDSTPVNRAVMALFRRKMAAVVGADSALPGYDGIVELTWMLNTKFPSAEATQAATLGILLSLMPSWLPALFKVMFAQPFPALSNSMNAYITMLTCQWLMGKCTVNDVELPDGQLKARWGMKVERCRYLEAAGCASVCMNSCKVPTQTFFKEAMGIDLEMTPNYDDFSCQAIIVPGYSCRKGKQIVTMWFSFGCTAPPQAEDAAFTSPCFGQCPRKAAPPLMISAAEGKPCHLIQLTDGSGATLAEPQPSSEGGAAA